MNKSQAPFDVGCPIIPIAKGYEGRQRSLAQAQLTFFEVPDQTGSRKIGT